MGRSITSTYVVEFLKVIADGRPVGWTPQSWNSKQAGRPTLKNLEAFVKGYEASTQPGGCNEQLGVTTILSARIVRNDGSHTEIVRYDGQ
jgi:hypothetical protein